MLESGIKLLRDILFNDSPNLSYYDPQARIQAAEGLGRIGTNDCIYHLRDYIVTGDNHSEVLAEAIDAYAWALDSSNNRMKDSPNRASEVSRW